MVERRDQAVLGQPPRNALSCWTRSTWRWDSLRGRVDWHDSDGFGGTVAGAESGQMGARKCR